MADWWSDRPWRMIQTNLREVDMADISARQVVADLRSFRANLLMINAAGIIASYPTSLPFHFQSRYLTGDSLADIVDACHEADIRVIARTDFSKVRRPIYERYPQWAFRTAAGDIVDYNGDVHVCINSDYQQEHALTILQELFTELPFDGVFFNMGGFVSRDYSGNNHGPCHCQACLHRLDQMFGRSVPTGADPDDPAWRDYLKFQQRVRAEHEQRVYAFFSDRWPDLCIANHRHAGRGFIRQESNTAYVRPLPRWAYSASDNTRWAVASHPAMVSSNTSVDFIDFPLRHVAVAPAQQRLRLVQSLANGGALDWYLIGRIDNHADRSGFAPVREVFDFHARHEQAYRDMRPVADVALLRGPHMNVAEYRGWFRFLVEHHFLFDTPVAHGPDDVDWSRYAAIILPDQQAISDALAQRVDQFVEQRGVLIASGQPGRRDETLSPRQRPALQSLGLEEHGIVRDDMRSAYLRVDNEQMADTDLLYIGDRYVLPGYREDVEPALKLIPPQRFGPPERCYTRMTSDHPGYVVRPHGRGRAIHLPWWPGSLFHDQGHLNTLAFAGALLRQVAGLTPLGGNLPPMVEATVMRSADGTSTLVHLINGAGHFGNTFHDPPRLAGLNVELPCDVRPGDVQRLRDVGLCEHTWQGGALKLELGELDAFEVVQIKS